MCLNGDCTHGINSPISKPIFFYKNESICNIYNNIKCINLTCNCVSILLDDPVICELSFRKWAIKRRSSFRFMPSINDAGTKRSKPNSRLFFFFGEQEEEKNNKFMRGTWNIEKMIYKAQ